MNLDISTREASEAGMREAQKSFLCDLGVEHQELKDFARHYQRAIFERFHRFAQEHLQEGLPLVISGGCGLNCDWNTRWRDSGLFADVFVPPCANDSGIAIGAALDAKAHFTGNPKADWSVYAGQEFFMDAEVPFEFLERDPAPNNIAAFLAERDRVIAWVQGPYEIGPRALCHRSLLGAPFEAAMHAKLNRIKQREAYRPIAPVCAEEDVSRFFEWRGPSPYMLYFQRVKSERLKAVTHVDGTARLQTVSAQDNPETHALLKAFENRTGFPVLCNTSLNWKGRGFINRMSDLVAYVLATEVDGMVVNEKFYVKRSK